MRSLLLKATLQCQITVNMKTWRLEEFNLCLYKPDASAQAVSTSVFLLRSHIECMKTVRYWNTAVLTHSGTDTAVLTHNSADTQQYGHTTVLIQQYGHTTVLTHSSTDTQQCWHSSTDTQQCWHTAVRTHNMYHVTALLFRTSFHYKDSSVTVTWSNVMYVDYSSRRWNGHRRATESKACNVCRFYCSLDLCWRLRPGSYIVLNP
jgi:hypothetical protein